MSGAAAGAGSRRPSSQAGAGPRSGSRCRQPPRIAGAPRVRRRLPGTPCSPRGRGGGGGPGGGSRGGAGAGAVPPRHSRARAPAGISLHVDSLTDHSCSAESDGEKLPGRAGDPLCESGSECKEQLDDLDDEEDEEEDGARGLAPPKPVTSSPLTGLEAPLLGPPPEAAPRGGGKAPLGSRTSPGAPQPAGKPKLWSLAEIATSDLKQPSLGPGCAPPGLPAAAAPASAGAPPGGSPYPASPLLGRHLYYTPPFYGNYTNYGNLNAALQGQALLRYNSAAAAPGDALHLAPKAASDAGKAGAHPLEPHYRPPAGGYEPKKGRLRAARGSPGSQQPQKAGPRGGGDPRWLRGAFVA